MQDGLGSGQNMRALPVLGGVSQFASDVVARLVSRESQSGTMLRDDMVQRFIEAVTSPDAHRFDSLTTDLRRARIPLAVFADRYVPEIARRMGQAWVDDRMSFANVSLGSARLQALLREIGADWAADCGAEDRGTLLVILPVGEQHTLGAMVLVGQLRRRGISVCLQIGPNPTDLRTLLAQRHFDGAMISGGTRDMFAACQNLVLSLNDMTKGRLCVAVGGAMLDVLPPDSHIRGAIAVTNDLTDALFAMGLVSQAAPLLEYS